MKQTKRMKNSQKTTGYALSIKEDAGSCEVVWFNEAKGFGEVRFVNTENLAIIFKQALPKGARVGSLLNGYAKISKDSSSFFWGGQLVIEKAEIP